MNPNFPQVMKVSLENLDSSSIRFFGEVKGGQRAWAGTMIVRFYNDRNEFVDHDRIPITPGRLEPNQYGTFATTASGQLANCYRRSDPRSGTWKRTYDFSGQ
jgi:hypothetical protein